MSDFDIAPHRRPSLIQALHITLERLQEREHLRPDDPGLQQLKRSILTMIAELDGEGNRGSDRNAPAA